MRAGYRGHSGEILAILGGEGGRVVTVDPTTGAVNRNLFTLWGATQLTSDPSGQHILVERSDGLYLWSIGDAAPHKLAKNILAATWVPSTQAGTRSPSRPVATL
jgi:hypothetical protein